MEEEASGRATAGGPLFMMDTKNIAVPASATVPATGGLGWKPEGDVSDPDG